MSNGLPQARSARQTECPPQMLGAKKAQRSLRRESVQQEADPGESPFRGAERADDLSAPTQRPWKSAPRSAEKVGPWAGRVSAFQTCYLGSWASEASLEDDVGRGPPLLRSLALASEASTCAGKEGRAGWEKAGPEGRAGPGRGADHHRGTAPASGHRTLPPAPASCE